MTRYFILFVLVITISSCARPYIDPAFGRITASHQEVAILPFDIIFTGRYPADLSDEQIMEIQNLESTDFQRSYYQSVLNGARRKKDGLTIRLQDYRKTNRLLEEAGYPIEEVPGADAQELAQILGVDAVLRGTIQKERIMSDLASVGVEVAQDVVQALGGGLPILPGITSINKRVLASYDIVDASTGSPIWSFTSDDEADWRQSNIAIMNEINSGAAKRFPYRERDREKR